jgi:hypothetical protein
MKNRDMASVFLNKEFLRFIGEHLQYYKLRQPNVENLQTKEANQNKFHKTRGFIVRKGELART